MNDIITSINAIDLSKGKLYVVKRGKENSDRKFARNRYVVLVLDKFFKHILCNRW